MKISLRTYGVELAGKKGSAGRGGRGSLRNLGNWELTVGVSQRLCISN